MSQSVTPVVFKAVRPRVSNTPAFDPPVRRALKGPGFRRGLDGEPQYRGISPDVRHEMPVQAELELVDVLRVFEAQRYRETDDARQDSTVDGYGLVAEVEIVILSLD